MATRFPPDVVVLDTDGFLHARLSRGKNAARIDAAKAYRLPAGTFTPGVVSPELTNGAALADTLRRLRLDSGRWDSVSILLPDSWFRINIVEMPPLPDRSQEALEAVRWSLKRTLPIAPESLRVSYETLQKTTTGVKLIVLSAVEKTLADIESTFGAAGMEVVLIEPIGINIWNAIAVRETATTNERLFVYVRDNDFTTAVFRGPQPLFIRSRNLSGDRTLQQEIRLSASYLRDSLQAVSVERCYVAGNAVGPDVEAALASEFDAPVSAVSLGDFVERMPSDVAGMQAELTACTGVFAG
jgi:Tfp pilus assembly PilM family ATPase